MKKYILELTDEQAAAIKIFFPMLVEAEEKVSPIPPLKEDSINNSISISNNNSIDRDTDRDIAKAKEIEDYTVPTKREVACYVIDKGWANEFDGIAWFNKLDKVDWVMKSGEKVRNWKKLLDWCHDNGYYRRPMQNGEVMREPESIPLPDTIRRAAC